MVSYILRRYDPPNHYVSIRVWGVSSPIILYVEPLQYVKLVVSPWSTSGDIGLVLEKRLYACVCVNSPLYQELSSNFSGKQPWRPDGQHTDPAVTKDNSSAVKTAHQK